MKTQTQKQRKFKSIKFGMYQYVGDTFNNGREYLLHVGSTVLICNDIHFQLIFTRLSVDENR